MRVVLPFVVIWFAWGGSQILQPGRDDGLEAVRTALGGSAALDAVHAFRMEGRSTRVIGPLRLASQVTLTLVRPDRFLRVDKVSLAGRTTEMTTGFAGATLLQSARGQDGARIDPADLIPVAVRSQTLRAAVDDQRRDLQRLLLAYLAGPFDFAAMTVASGGIAEAPDGRADVHRLIFPDGAEATLFTDVVTHRPLMVSWRARDALAPVRAFQGASAAPGPDAGRLLETPGEPPVVEHRFYFSDYRPVGTLLWPFVIRRETGGDAVEEIRVDQVAMNPRIDPKMFGAGR